jgi:hypothetical protein
MTAAAVWLAIGPAVTVFSQQSPHAQPHGNGKDGDDGDGFEHEPLRSTPILDYRSPNPTISAWQEQEIPSKDLTEATILVMD